MVSDNKNLGQPLTPSCVTFSNENEPIVGDYAVRQKIYDQANTIYGNIRRSQYKARKSRECDAKQYIGLI